jgi:hypothetical protein
VKYFFIQLTGAVVLIFFSSQAFSHAGPHENKNCFIQIDNTLLRFSGYQFQGVHPEHLYCRVFPDLGQTVIKIDAVNDAMNDKKVSLQLLRLDSWINWAFNSDKAFSSLKQTPLQNFNSGVNMIQADIQQRGVYALAVSLQIDNKKPIVQTFLLLGGIPVTEILVLFSSGVLLLLAFITVKSVYKKRWRHNK